MSATFTVHNSAGTQIGSALNVAAGSWRHQVAEDGSGRITVKDDGITSSQLAENVQIRVNDGTADRFAFVPTKKIRRQVGAETEVDLEGPGARWLLHAGQVLQEDTSGEPADERWFGHMSAAFDDSGWSAAQSHGKHAVQPWSTRRPTGWLDPVAEYITPNNADTLSARDGFLAKDFTVSADTTVRLIAAADDEFRLWVDSRLVFDTFGGGSDQWGRMSESTFELTSGSHRIAAHIRNLNEYVGFSPYYLICSAVPIDTLTGEVEGVAQRYAVYHDGDGGTWTATFDGFALTTSAIDWDASAATVQTELEAIFGSGNVDVTGLGTPPGGGNDPWIITFAGDLSRYHIPLTFSDSITNGNLANDEQVRGDGPDAVVRSDTSWVAVDDPASTPGLNAGEIMDAVISEAQARGTTVLDDLTEGYTTSADSDSTNWSTEYSFPFRLPGDIHRLAVVLEEMGVDVDMAADFTLDMYVARGTDLSGSQAITAGTAGVTNVSAEQDETTVKNVARVRTDEGWHESTDATSVTARGRWEAGLSLSGFSGEADADQVVSPLLDDLATPPKVTSLEIAEEAPSAPIPYADFDLADIISAPGFGTSGFAATDMRVVSIGGRVEEKSIVWSVELVD